MLMTDQTYADAKTVSSFPSDAILIAPLLIYTYTSHDFAALVKEVGGSYAWYLLICLDSNPPRCIP